MNKTPWTDIIEYLRCIPAAFLFAIGFVLALILFLPEEYARVIAVDGFRAEYRVFLGPMLLLVIAIWAARAFTAILKLFSNIRASRQRQSLLHNLTPEEKGYLITYINGQKTSVYVGLEDGVMAGLCGKNITYRATNIGSALDGFAFNLMPWARKYLEKHPGLLDDFVGEPLTPGQKFYSD